MCFAQNSRFCVICLLISICVPQSGADDLPIENAVNNTTIPPPLTTNTKPDNHSSTNMYSQLNKPNTTETNRHFFVKELMQRYGNGEVIMFEGFEHLLYNLGLGQIFMLDHNTTCHKSSNDSSQFIPFHRHHNHSYNSTSSESQSEQLVCYETSINTQTTHSHRHKDNDDDHSNNITTQADSEHDNEHDEHEHTDGEVDKTDDEHIGPNVDLPGGLTDEPHTEQQSKRHLREISKKCMPAPVLLRMFGNKNAITEEMFLDLCPALIYQMDRGSCHNDKPGSNTLLKATEYHEHDDHELEHDHDHVGEEEMTQKESLSGIPMKVWGYSTVAVLVISLVGLLGVAVIPIMQKVFYNHLLQFLVAMAVGALSGDALLHLLPHAMDTGHTDPHHDSLDEAPHSLAPVYKGLSALLGIYFFFLIERTLTIFTSLKRKNKKKGKRKSDYVKPEPNEQRIGQKLANNHDNHDSEQECDEMMMIIHPNKALKGYADDAHNEHCTISFDNTTAISHHHGNRVHHGDHDEEEDSSMLSHHSGGGHGHSHGNGGVPDSVLAIAWMVILGDGIHNLSDGLAIGAAFANSITGGFSTSIAVFCHELPHEIGDFAVLMRAGMSAKQAVIYNCLSSVLCFIGMVIGVAIGNIEGASLWIFAVIGGIFLYIALVDILPEMSSVDTKKGEHPLCHLLLQCTGMLLGAGIMLIIALYEDDLQMLFE